MKRRAKAICSLTLSLFLMLSLTGCDTIHDLKLKFGFRNDSFEDLREGSVSKISIQSTRDLSFKFIVTEPKAIEEMYGLLSNAEEVTEKSELTPDYIVEFHIGKEVKEFYYVVGEKNGNFYNDEIIFSVSNRLDEGIMKNLSFIRKPRDFEYIYYESILDILRIKKEEIAENSKIGIDINSDIDCLKYITSKDLENFIKSANKILPNVELIDNNPEEFDVVLTVKNRGYDSVTFKTKIDFNDKINKVQEDYYIIAENEFKEWERDISNPNEVPREW